MGWRENMQRESQNKHFYPYAQKEQKEQKPGNETRKNSFATIATIATNPPKVQKLQDELNYLWDKAWKLADWIDDPESDIPWQERAVRVPEVLEMGRQIDRLKEQQNNPVNDCTGWLKRDSGSVNQSEYIPLPKIFSPQESQKIDPDTCPARCKRTGKCYGSVYFTGKAGQSATCTEKQCPWIEQLNQYYNNKEEV